MNWSRRRVIHSMAAVAPMAFSRPALSQTTCVAGLVVVRVEVRREIAYVEGEVTIARGFGGTVKFKVPYYVQTSVVICEPAKPPPEPKPKSGWSPGGSGGGSGFAWFQADSEGMDGFFQGFSVKTRLPSFTRLSATNAKLTTVVGLTDGSSASLTSTLKHNGSEFRLADPASVRPFAQAYGPRLASFEQRISDIEVEAFANGADVLGVDTSFHGNALHTTDRLIHAVSGGSAPPGFFDPEGSGSVLR